jgi:4-hydroxy-2-oxoheptanedioate aldolase
LQPNHVKSLYESGQLALGTYITYPTAREVDALAAANLDFLRIDAYKFPWDYATMGDIVRTTSLRGLTPWARVRNDAWEIGRMLDLGAHALTVPGVSSAAEARAVVDAAFNPPRGQREPSVPEGFGSYREYDEWAAGQLIIGCQIETPEGIDSYQEIIGVPGVAVIHTGRNDIATALGVPGEQFHPKVLEVERRVVEATMAAGKQPALMYPLTDDGRDRALHWIEQGVRIFALDTDARVLQRAFGTATGAIRDRSQATVAPPPDGGHDTHGQSRTGR